MKNKLNIRSYSWFMGQLSWAEVVRYLMVAFEELGHNFYIQSTNGIKDSFINEKKMIESVAALQHFGVGKKQIDLDWCYTVPLNFKQRFLPNSKYKAAIYNFETTIWPTEWKQYYNLVDFYFPSSNFSAEIFHMNGVPAEKIFVIPHGVDTRVFNKSISPVKLNTQKKYKFVSVVAPHARKNIEMMLEAYCEAFSAKDDVCFVLKTKVFKHSDGMFDAVKNPNGRKAFEIVIGDVFKRLHLKYGENMPEIELLSGHVESVSSIYNACDCHISTTLSEGWGMPFLESMSCGLLNIAPRYSGQMDFMNDDNSLLIAAKTRYAKPLEQYWTFNPKAKIGQPSKKHTIELMRKAYREHNQLLDKFKPEMKKMVDRFSWTHAAQMMIDTTEGKLGHYKPGTYNWWPS